MRLSSTCTCTRVIQMEAEAIRISPRPRLKCGLDAVIVTDHNVLVRGFEGYIKDGKRKVLMLIGQEIHDQDRDPQKNHLLVFGAEKELATFADDPQMLINAYANRVDYPFLLIPMILPRPRSTRQIFHGKIGRSRITPASNFGMA